MSFDLDKLPDLDSRLHENNRKRKTKAHYLNEYMEYCYCVSCHKAGALVTPDTDIIFCCDSCVSIYGGLPLPEVPASVSKNWKENI